MPDDARRVGQAPPWVIDALVGTAVALALALIIATRYGGGPPTAGPYVFATGLGGLMLLRRRMPRVVLVASALGMFAYYALDYPPIDVVPVVAALFSAAEAGLTLWSIGTALTVFAVSMVARALDGHEAIGFLVGYESVSNLALFAAAIALGFGVRAGRLRVAQHAEIVRLTEAQLAREAELRLQSERERISRARCATSARWCASCVRRPTRAGRAASNPSPRSRSWSTRPRARASTSPQTSPSTPPSCPPRSTWPPIA